MVKILRPPREGGVYGVWLGGLLFAAKNILVNFDLNLAMALLASLLFLLTLDHVRYGSGFTRLAPVALVAALFTPALAAKPLYWMLYAALALSLLLAHFRSRRHRVIYGSGVLALTGSILWVYGNWDFTLSLTPFFFSLFAVAEAYERVYDRDRVTTAAKAFSGAGLLAVALYMFNVGHVLAFAVYVLDFAARIVGELTGLYARLSLKQYGFLETFRHIAVLGTVGFLVTP